MSGPVVLFLRALLAISLYAFLAWTLINLWRDIRQQGALLTARHVPPISLTMKLPDSTSRVLHFTQPEITIGRDTSCECAVEDDTVSARHARLSYHHGQWWLEDLDSTNGTRLNLEILSMPTVVVSHDEFSCGEITFTILMTNETSKLSAQPVSRKTENDS